MQHIVASDERARGVSTLCRPEFWSNALDLLIKASRILIVTGFYIKSKGACETDGPPGAVVLGRALARVGKQVVLLTDSRNHACLKACSRKVGGPVVACIDDPLKVSLAMGLLVFIERPGRASNGSYYNMRGLDISDVISPLDVLAERAAAASIPVLAIGDGGNEAGMGVFFESLLHLMPEYQRCLSVVPSDVCLPVDISNWGGYALSALLSVFYRRWLGLDELEETAMLEVLLQNGAVDGVSGESSLSVDGLNIAALEETASKVKRWYQITATSWSHRV